MWKVFVNSIDRTGELLTGQGQVSVEVALSERGQYVIQLEADGFPGGCPPVTRFFPPFVIGGEQGEEREAYHFATLTQAMSADEKTSTIAQYVEEIEEVRGSNGFAIIHPRAQGGEEEASAQRRFIIEKVNSLRERKDWKFRTAYGSPQAEAKTDLWVLPPGAGFPPGVSWGTASLAAPGALVRSLSEVLPQSVCRDLFGNSVKKRYYCIQVQLHNLSDKAVMLSGFYFQPRAAGRAPILAGSQSAVRATLVRGRETGFRNRAAALARVFVPLLGGFTGFFDDDEDRARYAQLVNVLGGGFGLGLEVTSPERTLAELERLEQHTLPNGPINRGVLAPHSSVTTYVFIPKDVLGLEKRDRDDREKVVEALGSLVPVGFAYTPSGAATFLNQTP